MSKRIVIIIPTNSEIGGAENRFFELWCELSKMGLNIWLACSKNLFNDLIDSHNHFSLNLQLRQFHIPFTFSSGREYSKSCKVFISKFCNLDDILHFVLEHPTFSPAQSTIFSSTCTSLKLFNLNGKLVQLSSPFFADITDVLDPSIFSLYKILYKYKKSIYLTKCSFTNNNLFTPNFPKKKQIVFLGRFSSEKQILPFCKSIPLIDRSLKSHMLNYSFLIIGNGPLLNDLQSIITSNSFRNINVKIINTHAPHVYLNDSEIFVSLQRFNNYPSKSLIEAIAAGNLIIATDCGQTNFLAKHEFTRYIPEKFKPADIAKAALSLCGLDDVTKTKMAIIGRQFVISTHSLARATDYYKNIYKTISN